MKLLTILYVSLLAILISPLIPLSVQAAIDNSPDNDTVAIIRGGVFSESSLRQKAAQGDVPTVFGAFGIAQNELNGFVDGVVYRDGRVTIGSNEVVARNAVTAGRWDEPKSGMSKIPGTDRAYKMSTRYFTDEGQTAFIKMVNGRFSFAVIKPCGNPVTATPVAPPKPNLSVSKDVSKIDTTRWQQTVTIEPGEAIKYRVVIKNTGRVVMDRLSIRDTLPEGIAQAEGTMRLNDRNITNNFKAGGFTLPPLQPGQQHVLVYAATTNQSEQRRVVCNVGLTNNVTVGSGGVLPDISDSAVVKLCASQTPPSTPVTPVSTTPSEPTGKAIPETLVDTGPGALVGGVLSSIVGGFVAYKYVWLRRVG